MDENHNRAAAYADCVASLAGMWPRLDSAPEHYYQLWKTRLNLHSLQVMSYSITMRGPSYHIVGRVLNDCQELMLLRSICPGQGHGLITSFRITVQTQILHKGHRPPTGSMRPR